MKLRSRAILVNTGIAAGLLLMYFHGTPLLPLVITGIFLFALANILMVLKRGK